MKIGILGAGNIANVLAKTMIKMKDVNLYAVASRDLNKAKDFASRYKIEKAYGSYEELAKDPDVELIYIATPHSHHFEHMALCINNGKNVLCEKSFTLNAEEAKKIKDLCDEKKVYVAEAIWTRYMPSRSIINQLLSSGIIGKVTFVTANLSYDIDGNERIMNPALAGGALLDVGVYGINFFLMHLGKEIDKIESSVQMTDTGVDAQESITFFYKDGTMAVTTHSIYGRSDRHGVFVGDKGYIVVDNINNPLVIEVFDTNDKKIKRIRVPKQISGYEYEIKEAIDCIKSNSYESVSMPLSESIFVMKIMDSIRKQWNMVYPKEV